MDQDNARLVRAGAHGFLFNALTLGVNLATGVMVARELGSSGRGEFTAITTVLVIGVWIFSLGCTPAASFFIAREPHHAGRFMGTWLAIIVTVSVVATAVLELALPTVLGAQASATQDLARLYVLTLIVGLLYQLAYGALLGGHDFFFVYLVGFLRPLAIAVGFGLLIALHALSVESAVATTLSVDLVVCAISLQRALKRYGLERPRSAVAKRTAWYGLRAQGTHLGGIINGRLDVFILPAFLGASSVGLYSVATNVSWIVFTLASALSTFVLPVAAPRGRGGTSIVLVSLYATLAVGVLFAGVLGILGGVAVHLVYGPDFAGSVLSLRLLLPGTVAFSLAVVLLSGLDSLGRPGASAAAQAPGVLITVVGLLVFLDQGGIVAAAIVSSVAYTAVLVTALVLYRSAARLSWREFVLRPGELLAHLRSLGAVATRRIPAPRRQEL